jgi:hypothetical protein
MSLISLTYVSTETREMSEQDLIAILEKARSFNPTKEITGLLVYRKGYFIQALEGEEEDVMALYEKIAKDERHRGVMLVAKEKIEQRSFGKWGMGFQNLDVIDPEEYKGYKEFADETFDSEFFKNNPTRAKTLLHLFVNEANY